LLLALRIWICSLMLWAAFSISRKLEAAIVASAGLRSAATRVTAGTSSRRSPSRFAANSAAKNFHVVFSLPAKIADIAYQNKAAIYDILFKASAEAMITIAADPKHLGARIGLLSVLHTWG
jgi:hypothetical protein